MSLATVRVSELYGYHRLDGEFYQPLYQDNEALVSRFPTTKKLGEITTKFAKGIFDISADEYVTDGVPFIRINNLKNCIIEDSDLTFITPEKHKQEAKTALRKYDLVLSKTAYPAASLVQLETCNTSQDTIAVRTKLSDDFNCYLAVYLNTRFGLLQMKRLFQGNVQMHIALPDAKTITIPIPSTAFQSKIRRLFEQSFFKRDEANHLYTQAQFLLAAELGLDKLDLSESLFSVRCVADVQEAGRADAEYYKRKYANLLQYLDSKPHTTLEELATFSGGATPLGAEYPDAGIPFLRIQNVGENRLVMDDVAYIDETIHGGELKRSQLAPRDVLITITGRIGTSAVVPDDLKRANINQHIVRMRLKANGINPYYLAAFLNSVGGKLQTEREAYGTTRDALPYYCLAKVRVLKADKQLQKEIEKIVCKADNARHDAQRLLEEAKTEVERLIERV